MRLEQDIEGGNSSGDLLIVHKGVMNREGDNLAYVSGTSRLCIWRVEDGESNEVRVIGHIVEERFNGL